MRSLLPLLACSATEGLPGPSAATGAWAQSGYDGTRAGRSPWAGPTAARMAWEIRLAGGYGRDVVLDAAGGAVVVLPGEEGAEDALLSAHLVRLDAQGQERWRRTMGPLEGPVLAADGSVLVPERGAAGDVVVAVGPEGDEQWRLPLDGERVAGALTLGPNGRIFVGATMGDERWDARRTRMRALSPEGAVLWERTTSERGYLSTAATDGRTLYVGGERLRALNAADGAVLWEVDVATVAGAYGPAITPDGSVVVAVAEWSARQPNTLLAVGGGTGWPLWSRETGFLEMTPAIGEDGTIYFHSWAADEAAEATGALADGAFALAPDGALLWELRGFMRHDGRDPDVTDPTSGSDGAPVVDPLGTVYFGDDPGRIYAIRDGRLLWRADLGFEWDTRPAIRPDGVLVLCNAGGPGHTRCVAIASEGPEFPDRWMGWEDGEDGEEGEDDEELKE